MLSESELAECSRFHAPAFLAGLYSNIHSFLYPPAPPRTRGGVTPLRAGAGGYKNK